MKRSPDFRRNCIGLLFALLPVAVVPASAKCIGRDEAGIRSRPSLNSGIIFAAPLGYPARIEKNVQNWILFHDWQKSNGWVYKPLVADIKTAVVLVNKARIRRFAGRKASVVATVGIGEMYKILSQKGNWSKLGSFHGGSIIGWIRNDLILGE
jgi:SH3-like domain-containing protein